MYSAIAAIAAVTVMETAALLTGTDGRYFGLSLIIVAGLGGYNVGRLIERRSSGKSQSD